MDAGPKGFLRWRREHALPPGSACRNCATVLQGPWCHQCGQLGEDFHHSALHLLGETFENFFHADGRVVRTLPRLILEPARLTKDFLNGKRAPQIPPLRLFLTMLLILFLAGSISPSDFSAMSTTDADRARIKQSLKIDLGEGHKAVEDWLKVRLPRVIDHPDTVARAMGEWAHRFAFAVLPISALLLSLIFVFRRDLYLFDHLIFSMHSLSFQGLLITLVLLGKYIAPDLFALLLLAAPVHLYIHMRGTYGLSSVGTLIRMGILSLTSAIVFGLLLLGLVIIGVNAA